MNKKHKIFAFAMAVLLLVGLLPFGAGTTEAAPKTYKVTIQYSDEDNSSKPEGEVSFDGKNWDDKKDKDKINAGESVTVHAKLIYGKGYEFAGWYDGNELKSPNLVYTFDMPEKNVTLKAVFRLWQGKGIFSVKSENPSYGTVSGSVTVLGTTYPLNEGNGFAYNKMNWDSKFTVTVDEKDPDNHPFVGWAENGKIVSTSTTYSGAVKEKETHLTATFKKTLAITANGYNGVYDGEAHKGSVTVSDMAGTTVSYSTDDGVTWNTTEPSITNAGEIAVQVKAEKEGYDAATASYTLKVTEAPVTITVANARKQFGDGDPIFTGKVEGLVNDTDLGTITYGRTNNAEEVGTYPQVLTATYTENNNYAVTVNKGDFMITPASKYTVTVKADPEDGGMVTGGGEYDAGQPATVTAKANAGYELAGWYDEEGNNVHWDEEYTILSVDDNMTLIAKFVKVWKVTYTNCTIDGEPATGYDHCRDGEKYDIPVWSQLEGWLDLPANSKYDGVDITDKNGTNHYAPGDKYTMVSDATVKVVWKSTATPPPTTPPATPPTQEEMYMVTEGAHQKVIRGNAAKFVVKLVVDDGSENPPVSANDKDTYGKFTEVVLDGKALTGGYTKASGSLILTLSAETVSALENGSHNLEFHFTDGLAETGFTLADANDPSASPSGDPSAGPTAKPTADPNVPRTADDNHPALWVLLAAASLMGALAMLMKERRRQSRQNG